MNKTHMLERKSRRGAWFCRLDHCVGGQSAGVFETFLLFIMWQFGNKYINILAGNTEREDTTSDSKFLFLGEA